MNPERLTAGQIEQTWPIASLLPHAGNMILLDAVCHVDADSLRAQATVKPNPYALPDGSWPAWLGLELMAQAVGAWAGCQAKRTGQPVQLGFLLGTRRYENHTDVLAPGTQLGITAQRSLTDTTSGMGIFECAMYAGNAGTRYDAPRLLAQARLNIYQPPDPEGFIREHTAP